MFYVLNTHTLRNLLVTYTYVLYFIALGPGVQAPTLK